MATFCIPPAEAEKLKKALASREVTVKQLREFKSSAERIKFLEEHAGLKT
jgi:hypothetical protein